MATADSFHSARVLFLREQDGVVERELKSRLVEIFRQFQTVKAAYLVRISYTEVPGISVAVALVGGEEDAESIVPTIGAAFGSFFHANEHMDILFLNPSQIEAVAKVAANFYTADPSPGYEI